ncbi:MAG TPA: hypothetical protein VG994_02445 [Steroidobacteraceae bacterium]|nr:hypothetical protein [Steroidobacteraceae bacterium]
MAEPVTHAASTSLDPVSNVLKWILLAVALITFALLGLATVKTYERSPPIPERFVSPEGKTLFTAADIVAGKGGFQKADLMDYGSLYGMGSYYGQDYTAYGLVQLGTLTRDRIARERFGAPFDALSADQQAAATSAMQGQLQTPGIISTGPAGRACGCRWAACSRSSKCSRWCC